MNQDSVNKTNSEWLSDWIDVNKVDTKRADT